MLPCLLPTGHRYTVSLWSSKTSLWQYHLEHNCMWPDVQIPFVVTEDSHNFKTKIQSLQKFTYYRELKLKSSLPRRNLKIAWLPSHLKGISGCWWRWISCWHISSFLMKKLWMSTFIEPYFLSAFHCYQEVPFVKEDTVGYIIFTPNINFLNLRLWGHPEKLCLFYTPLWHIIVCLFTHVSTTRHLLKIEML